MNQVPKDTNGVDLVLYAEYYLDQATPHAKYIGVTGVNDQILLFEHERDGQITVARRTLPFLPKRLGGVGGRRKSKSKSKSKKRKTKRKKYVKNKSRRR